MIGKAIRDKVLSQVELHPVKLDTRSGGLKLLSCTFADALILHIGTQDLLTPLTPIVSYRGSITLQNFLRHLKFGQISIEFQLNFYSHDYRFTRITNIQIFQILEFLNFIFHIKYKENFFQNFK